ncbi:hypothetical protein [Natrinema pallidum]|uniref:Uncharacterized protein n=1 Tax=Natrinema pallidum TaxID=69527 RepID=A0A4P9TJW9_9EURY|nr:hypothetical protein [Natrinema pallidum]QCW05311.1 hypothetical protein FGF80_18905 [Natrinema pallidum]
MQDFTVGEGTQTQSIGFDATKRSKTVVTVGVLLNRTQEALLLDDFCETIRDDGYLPFRTKSRDLSLDPETATKILSNCNGEVAICTHQGDVTLEYAEAVHSAIIINELNITTDNTIAIVDGSRSRADNLAQAVTPFETTPPPITNCVQSEFYYPHLLLADLVAGAIADTFRETDRYLPSISLGEPVGPLVDTTSRRDRWNRGYSAVARGEGEIQQPTYEQRYADSVKERVSCWFQGQFGKTHAPSPESDGVRPVVGRLKAMECESAATWLDDQ